jgi:hypothetical protein
MSPVYVYGLVSADTPAPDGVRGLGPSGRVWTITHGRLAAVVSDLPSDRPLGTRSDLLGHEAVVDAVAETAAVLPMRFPAVVEESGVVQELLEPHQERFAAALDGLTDRVQFTLKGRYDEDTVLREVLESDEDIRALRERVQELPEDATYYDRVRLGELVVGELEARREVEAAQVLERLSPLAAATAPRTPAQPEDIVDVAFLVPRSTQQAFEDAVEDIGKDLHGRVHLRLLGPLAPYDFVGDDVMTEG